MTRLSVLCLSGFFLIATYQASQSTDAGLPLVLGYFFGFVVSTGYLISLPPNR